jgi:hypothetical protein
MATEPLAPFQLHLEPDAPIELGELTGALAAIAHQFEVFAIEEGLAARAKDARLLVSSVRPGSIDIGLLPDLAATMGPLLVQMTPIASHVLSFATKLKGLIDAFRKKDVGTADITVRDCEDVAAIMAPIANHGGSQSVRVHNGDVYQTVIAVSTSEAQQIGANAALLKAALQFPDAETHQRVSMVWAGLDTDNARLRGQRNPDKGLIEEIDPKPRPVFFEDQFAYLKKEMLEDEENPYRKIYFVDVSVSRVEGRVASYRIVGFHGTDEREVE